MGKRQRGIGMASAILASAALLGAGCGGEEQESPPPGPDRATLDLVAFSDLKGAYRTLEPAFRKTYEGLEIGFDNAFGPSATQSRAVAAGRAASLVHFAQAGDVERLVDEGLVDGDWDEQPYRGNMCKSVIVFIVRPGNPKQIHNVDQLLSRDIDVVVPNPFSSDAGRWSVINVYGTLIHERKSEEEALAGVRTVLEKAVAQPAGVAEAFATFRRGVGDVLMTYESEAIKAVEAGKRIRFVVPHQTTLVEFPIAATEGAPQPAAEDFLEFLWSDEGQVMWAEAGFRPVNPRLVDQERFYPRNGAFRISQLGGWSEVNEEFFGEDGSVTEIERELGVPTRG